MLKPQLLTEEEISTRLQDLTTGLCYQSESDYPLEVVQLPVIVSEQFTTDSLRAIMSLPTEMPVEVNDLTSFFRHVIEPENAAKTIDHAEQISTLQIFCEQHLQDCKVYRVGSRTVTALLLGKTPEGKIVGLKTTIIQT